jgi:TP901 family phage tail tape measure protein
MAVRTRGLTVTIDGDTTGLTKALESVNKEVKNTQAQLKDVDKLLKLDPTNTELLSQKQRLLGDAVSETRNKLDTLKTASDQANISLANGEISQEQFDALQREIAETTLELKRLEEQAKQSNTAVQEIAAKGEKLKTMGDNVSSVGEKFLPATAAVVGLGTAAVKTASDFDTGMSKVAAISGATGGDLDALRDKAREMGAKTKFSASEAAAAMEYMAMAGWKTSDMLGGIEGIMNLAAASGEDLATTSDIVTDALTAFGLSANDAGHFADILAAASSNANTNVSMMGETFKYAAPIAGALGYSAEDTALAIGLMANAGIKGSQAGTSLRKMMTELSGEIKIAGEAIGTVTIQTTNADGSMRELNDILMDCREAFSHLSESEKAAAAEALVGKTAMSGFLAIMNASEADVNKLSEAIANCDGVSQQMADTMQDNLEGQLTILKSQLQELAISFGEILIPAIRGIVSAIQGVVDWLNSLSEGTKRIITTIALLVAAIGPVLIVVGKVMSAIGTIMTWAPKIAGAISTVMSWGPKIMSAITAVKGAISSLWAVLAANPIVLIIAAVAALVAAFIYLWNNSEGFRNFWINLWETLKNAVTVAVEAIGNFLSQAWTAITTTAQTVWTAISEFFSGVWEGIKTIVSTATEAISSAIATAWTAIYAFFEPLLSALQYLFETIWQAIQILIEMALDAISMKIQEIWNGIVAFLTPILEGISSFFQSIWTAITNTVSNALNAIRTTVTNAWNTIKGVITSVMNAISSTVSSVWNSIKSTVTSLMNSISSSVQSIWNNMRSAIAGIISQIYSTISSGLNQAVSFVTGLIGRAYSWGRDLIMGIVNGIRSAIGAVADAARSVADAIRSVLHFSVPDEGPLTDYESWMPDFMKGLARGIEKSRGLVSAAMDDVASGMVLSPSIEARGAEAAAANGAEGTSLIQRLTEALAQTEQGGGDITIPVYIGQDRIDEIVVTAAQRANYRSGGR